MVNKSLLLGFGLGLVFSAGYLLVTPTAGGKTDIATETQLKQAAEALNLVVLPKAEYQRLLKKQEPSVTKPVSPKKPKATVPPVTTKPPAVSTPTVPTTPAPVKEARETVSFRVEAGSKSFIVAQNLVKAELLPQNNQFVQLLKEKNKLNRIRSGTFQIPKGANEEEIITILTTPPKK